MISSLVALGIFLIFPVTSADEGNTPQQKDAGQSSPPGTFQKLPYPSQYKQETPPLPSTPENQGTINPRTGEHYPPSGEGVINPRTGEYYPRSGQGFINPRTGTYYSHFSPGGHN